MTGPSFLNFDGAVLPVGQGILTADNRGFRYGDGLFETMLAIEGRVRLWPYHFERLLSGMRMLRFEPTAQFVTAIEQQEGSRKDGTLLLSIVHFHGEGSRSRAPDQRAKLHGKNHN